MKKKKDEVTIRSSTAEYLTYVASVGARQDSIEMRYEDENIWLTQKMMAILYDVGLPTISLFLPVGPGRFQRSRFWQDLFRVAGKFLRQLLHAFQHVGHIV